MGETSETGEPVLLVRADASPEIGTGHVMRCLALAQAWQADGGSVTFVGTITPTLENRLEEDIQVRSLDVEAGSLDDADKTARLVKELGASWVVVDGYHFGGDYQQRLREDGLQMLLIDDYGHADWYEADLVLNQNISAEESLYERRADHTDLLMGLRFALLRKEFWPWRAPRKTPRRKANHVLVTLGGADPENLTERVVRALGQMDVEDFRATVVVGGSNPHEGAIRTTADEVGDLVEVRSDVSDMASLMAESDVAVSAGGSTCWELAFMGIPNVIVILAENQRGIASGLDEAGTAINLGWWETVTESEIAGAVESLLQEDERRLEMAGEGQELVDGWGAKRVAQCLGKGLMLRPAQEQDCELLWRWANDPEVRRKSYNSAPIPWEGHQDWFETKLNSSNCALYIAGNGKEPIGQIRFDMEGGVGEVSVTIDAEKRGEGYGTALIQAGTSRLYEDFQGVTRVDAFIKEENKVSVRVFEKAGYCFQEKTVVEGEPSYRFSYFS